MDTHIDNSRKRNFKSKATIYHKDCRSAKTILENNSIDCIITDPPYYLDKFTDKWNVNTLKKSAKKGKVIKFLPVGMKFDKGQGEKLEKFMNEIANVFIEKLKPGGFFLCFSQPRLAHRTAMGLENAGLQIRDMLVWERPSQGKAFSLNHFVEKMPVSQTVKHEIKKKMQDLKTPMLKSEHETIILAQKIKEGTHIDNFLKWRTGLLNLRDVSGDDFPKNVFKIRKPSKKERKFEHMTLKPIALLRKLIQLFSLKDQIILDCFSGSGTTAVAAILENRKAIGFEINEFYYRVSLEKIKYYENQQDSLAAEL